VKVGDLATHIQDPKLIGIVVDTAGKYVAIVDNDGQRYVCCKNQVEVVSES
jgi:hypothetical protein